MIAVLASIKPRHTANIKARKKSLEVRKNVPPISNPFKVYVYETKDGGVGAGAVVCEFMCDWICFMQNPLDGSISQKDCQAACLTEQEIRDYAAGRSVYGWHISELKVYEKPRGLEEFTPHCRYMTDDMLSCDHHKIACNHQHFDHNPWPDCSLNAVICKRRMTRPPQSWCYVEEIIHG